MPTTKTPGPKGLPISGNLLAFRKNPLAFLIETQQQYGDIAYLRFGPSRHLYLISDPELIKEVLQTKQKSFKKAKGLQTAKAVVGEGILTSEGGMHLRQRRLMQPSFRKDRVSRYADSMVELTEQLLADWNNGEERSITDDMMELTLNIITHTMFGTSLKGGLLEIGHAVEVGMKYVSNKATSIFDIPESIPTKSNVEFKQAAQTLDEVIYGIIEERRNRQPADHTGDDLLSMLLAAKDEEDGSGMTDRQVRDEVMTIFLAGHETTANTLSWTWYLLSLHPEVERKLWQELDRELADRKPTVEDIGKLEYLNQIIWESMRLYPAVWVINREVTEEVEIGGHVFKPGETIMMSQYVMHRNPKYYDHPEQFIPERFADGELLKRIPQFAYFPFGGGPRVCIGNNFALMEAALVLATIASTYKLSLVPNHPDVEPEPLITLRPKSGLRMSVTKRKSGQ
ncbi:cytochrome P450 [Paenibacillus piri]|uniref:Cytochrome P450 n=1 Tax=Paenibacillus piri TaxID=2547395 RepID=A0A4R5KRB8_9BACL|nr:cytochrome P450 [Paenibacillus piri]TDF98146.1 cytochrome P450 [Paenibacillus piri]